jgi:two-component system, NtrC family, sensor histidine kinase HydH
MNAGEHQARILVVDDNAAFVENLVEILQAEGYSVRSASSVAKALLTAQAGMDVALVDLRLPDGDGSQLAKQLKENQPDSEIILLTGYATVESAAEAVRAGACAYLVKPCATPELLLTIEQALRQVRLQAEKRELTRRAQVAEKLAAVGTLTAGLSHEIRNPLNAAALQLSVAERRVERLPAELRVFILEPLSLVRDEIRRLEHILQDFLQFARPIQFVPKTVELNVVAQKVSSLLKGDAERRGIRLECSCPDGIRVLGDEGRLQQVLVNLALNALDAARGGGWVRLICRQGERDVIFSVEDSGAGIPAEDMPHIFEPFFTTKPAGSGLGLPIVHAIVTQHGGSIQAENMPGAGARFTVRLPGPRA